jgi:hypothetical protein
MSALSLETLTADDKDMLFGPEFRNIQLVDFDVNDDGIWLTRAILSGRMHTLVGDPRIALARYTEAVADTSMGGRA